VTPPYLDSERDVRVLGRALSHVAASLSTFFGRGPVGSWGAAMVDPGIRDALLDEIDLGVELLGLIRREVEGVAGEVLTRAEILAVEHELGIDPLRRHAA
jgi:hypothetical protein